MAAAAKKPRRRTVGGITPRQRDSVEAANRAYARAQAAYDKAQSRLFKYLNMPKGTKWTPAKKKSLEAAAAAWQKARDRLDAAGDKYSHLRIKVYGR